MKGFNGFFYYDESICIAFNDLHRIFDIEVDLFDFFLH